MTKEEQREAEVQAVIDGFAEKGYLALYGGRKGHGFWIYRTTPEQVAVYYAVDGWCEIPGEIIQNNGRNSGNPYFWMMADAVKLLAALREKPCQ